MEGIKQRKDSDSLGKKIRVSTPEILFLTGTLLLFILLRLRNLNNVLNYDEAKFVFIIRALVSGSPGALYGEGMFYHPPIYLILCRLTHGVFGESVPVYRSISVAFSAGSLLILFKIAKDLYGKRVALLSCFCLAALPASNLMDAWIKMDSICVFFMLISLMLFLRKSYIWSGVALGASLLSKENAVFLALLLGLYFLLKPTWKELKGLVITIFIGALMSFWWYAFLSKSGESYFSFFAGSSYEAKAWHYPWHIYISNSWKDLGVLLLAIALIGFFQNLYKSSRLRRREYALPLVWIAAVYLPLCFSHGKPFWMVTIALPAWAICGGLGLDFLYQRLQAYGEKVAVIALSLIILSLALISTFNGDIEYMRERDEGYYDNSLYSRQAANYLNGTVPQPGTLISYMSPGSMPNPILLYYLNADIHVELIPFEHIEAGQVPLLIQDWRDSGAKAGFFYPDFYGDWLTPLYHYYLGGRVERTPYGYLLIME